MPSTSNLRVRASLAVVLVVLIGLGCGSGSPEGLVLFVDAEYNPGGASDTTPSIDESSLAVAQTFTVQEDGKFERFQIVVSQGAAGSSGTIRIDVRPVVGGGMPEADDTNSIITPIDIDTSTLPAITVEDYTIFDVGDQPGREVLAGEQYAIVVSFRSRTAGVANAPIALVYGRSGNEYADGTGSRDPDGLGFVNNAFDYFFRTFVLR